MKFPNCWLLLVAAVLTGGLMRAQSSDAEKMLNPFFRHWLREDVRWIITHQEQEDFLRLSNDVDRNNFIEQFWLKRNPNPSSPVNRYKIEHYRRIAYVNVHFHEDRPGWKTDRGRTYIELGAPNEIRVDPEERSEVWHYQFFAETSDDCEKLWPLPSCLAFTIDWITRHPQGVLMDIKFADVGGGRYQIQPDHFFSD